MEALTAASVAVLTLYDMLKVFDENMEMTGVKLIEKTGGKSDFAFDPNRKLKAAVLVVSDSVSAGKKQDLSGKLIVDRLEKEGLTVSQYKVVPDDEKAIETCIKEFADRGRYNLIISTGGTGLGPRDRTPEVVKRLVEMEIPGVAEAIRAYGQNRLPTAMLSRSLAGIRGRSLIITLPGSSRAVTEGLNALIPAIFHTSIIMAGGGHGEPQEHAKQEHAKHEHSKHSH